MAAIRIYDGSMLDDGPLKTFLVLASEGKMSRAAAILHRTQPALSAQLARLEEDLGAPLFHRTSKGLVLTEAGRLFRAHAEGALTAVADGREAVRALAGLERGELVIGGGATATTYLLPPALRDFHRRYPAIRLRVREQGSRAVLDGVMAGELDLGIVTLDRTLTAASVRRAAGSAKSARGAATRGSPEARTGGLDLEPWIEDELLLLVPPEHRLAKRKSYRWKDLEGEPLVLFEPGTAVRELIDQSLARAGVQAIIVMELRSIDAIQQMVRQGIGMGFVSRWALSGSSTVRALRCAEDPLVRELALVTRADRVASAAARAFIELLRSVAASRGASNAHKTGRSRTTDDRT